VLVPFLAVLCSCSLPLDPLNGSTSTPRDLLGPVWELVSFQTSGGRILELHSWEIYHVTFESVSRFNGRADCNTIFGNYDAEQAGIISVRSVGTTYVGCREGSHDSEYVHAFASAKAYERQGDYLKVGFGRHGVLLYKKSK